MLRYSIIIFLLLTFFLQAQDLAEKQRNLAGRYSQLEQVLLRMSETSANSNPRRSALLKKVLLTSKEKLLTVRLETLIDILERRQLNDAAANQEGIEKDLLELLQLLESENRDQRREAEKERIKEYLRDLEEIIHQERNLKNRTAQQENEQLSPLEKDQKDVREQTQSLQERIEVNENPGELNNTPKNEESKEGSKEGPTAESKEESPSGSPSQQAMQKALKRMSQAEQKLKDAEKSGAVEEQEEAIAELQRAKAELEKILRQLREEELMQTLEKLEARFKRMLHLEQSIRSQTEKLGIETKNLPEVEQRQVKIRSERLGMDQQTVIEGADAALLLLREDGTAQAMVESLLQARFDMTEAKSRLDRTLIDSVTLNIEDAVIASLQEMIEAVNMAIDEAKKRQKNEPQEQMNGDGETAEQEEPLIQLLSELRMIRSMQRRVNERTTRYEKEVEQLRSEPNADYGALRFKVEELTRQQSRISRILHDLKVGKIK